VRLYNLFPTLAGRFDQWRPHLERAADLGFDAVFVNPIQAPGNSGSLYSIRDYFRLNPGLTDDAGKLSPEEQFQAGVTEPAGELGLQLIVDLVISHCAYDSDLLEEHPDWFAWEDGAIAHPSCIEGHERVVWEDLAKFDHEHSPRKEELFEYCLAVVRYLIELGFRGFRCDAAYQIPAEFWRRLIAETRRDHPGTGFLAETLGCVPHETITTAGAGFDFIFNSSKWWDFHAPWLLEQYCLTRETAPSISFPESHDTARLAEETGGRIEEVKQRHFFSSVFSAGVMMPVGFEFGFRRPLHVVETRPDDWEEPSLDLTDFIRHLNRVKAEHPILREEAPIELLPCDNPNILFYWKGSDRVGQEALILLNKDAHHPQRFWTEDLYRHILAPPPLIDVSPEHAMDHLPSPFHYELRPGQGMILVTPAP